MLLRVLSWTILLYKLVASNCILKFSAIDFLMWFERILHAYMQLMGSAEKTFYLILISPFPKLISTDFKQTVVLSKPAFLILFHIPQHCFLYNFIYFFQNLQQIHQYLLKIEWTISFLIFLLSYILVLSNRYEGWLICAYSDIWNYYLIWLSFCISLFSRKSIVTMKQFFFHYELPHSVFV